MLEISTATYLTSSPSVDKCPDSNLPEFAFIGRSNVGKSSLINMLCRHKGLAKTSSLPGKTLLINHFAVNNSFHIVDLPGYGYAKRSKAQRDALQTMISSYLLQREQLYCVFVLIDIRLEPQAIDLQFIQWLGENGIPFVIAFTKCDKIRGGHHVGLAHHWMKALKHQWEELPKFFLTSSESGLGRKEMLDFIESVLG